jgi:hypothetical protein
MKKTISKILVALVMVIGLTGQVLAASPSPSVKALFVTTVPEATVSGETATGEAEIISPVPTDAPRPDFTQKSEETVEPLKKILEEQKLGSVMPYNPIKYAIRGSVDAGVPPNTIVLLLLLPGVAALIAAARHLVGLRGFGIFLPAALSVVFVATGPVVGILLFLVIVFVSTLTRIVMRRFKIKLQYLPRMALLLHFVVLGILALLFLAPLINNSSFANVSIFPVLILVLLAEDFSRVQLGKSAKVAISLTGETLILSLASYIFLNLKFVQEFVLLMPELWIFLVIVFDYLMGKYVGLRILEYYRFRKLIKN